MPKSNEQTYNRQEQKFENREVGQDEDLLVKGKAQDARGLGSLVKPAGSANFVAPKMNPNEDMGAYAERVRKAREAHQQKKAMSR